MEGSKIPREIRTLRQNKPRRNFCKERKEESQKMEREKSHGAKKEKGEDTAVETVEGSQERSGN